MDNYDTKMDHVKKTLHIEREELDPEASVASGQGTTGGWGRWEESCGEGPRTGLVKVASVRALSCTASGWSSQ